MGDLIYIFVGWSYLWIRYRNKKTIAYILNEKYDGDYRYVGAELLLSAFGIFLIIILGAFLIIVIGRAIYDLIN